MNLPPDQASAIAGGRKCPRLLLTFQAEPQMKRVGWGCTRNHQLMSNKCYCMPLKLCFFVSQQKLTDTNYMRVCVCVCVCVCLHAHNPSPIGVGMYIYFYIYICDMFYSMI